jgi:hypothetical protein
MKATVLDLRRRMKDIVRALDQNESVTIFYRGKKKGILYPISHVKQGRVGIREHPAVGMWKDREDMRDVEKYVRDLRKGRGHAV